MSNIKKSVGEFYCDSVVQYRNITESKISPPDPPKYTELSNSYRVARNIQPVHGV